MSYDTKGMGMVKHASWTRKKHRSHVSGQRVLHMSGLQDRLVKDAKRLSAKYLSQSKNIEQKERLKIDKVIVEAGYSKKN